MARLPNTLRPGSPMRAAAPPWADAAANRFPRPAARHAAAPTALRGPPPPQGARIRGGAAARPADMGPTDVRLATMRPADMRRPDPTAAACSEAYSAAVPAKPAA